MARPRKDPFDPKWQEPEAVVAPATTPPANDDLMVAMLMAGYIARGGPISHETMLRQARELVEMIKAK